MHMSDALLSPTVGVGFVAASAAAVGYAAHKLEAETRERPGLVPLMGITAAFVFAAQMLNFSIPGTGSSGHLGGGMILAALLGSPGALIAIASVLIVQALFFADGGLLALGTNIFNLGVIPCLLVAPIVRRVTREAKKPAAIASAYGAGAWVSLMLGAFMVTVETLLSGRTELPFGVFAGLMLPIHAAIGVVEAVVTGLIVLTVLNTRPEIIRAEAAPASRRSLAPVLAGFAVLAVICGTTFAWFASTCPDGLEWSIGKVTGAEELPGGGGGWSAKLAAIQERTAFLPDYAFPSGGEAEAEAEAEANWPNIDAGTSVSGFVGALITLAVSGLLALLFVRLRSHPAPAKES